jgi:hypothetical protein
VAPKVAGSSPVGHPPNAPAKRGKMEAPGFRSGPFRHYLDTAQLQQALHKRFNISEGTRPEVTIPRPKSKYLASSAVSSGEVGGRRYIGSIVLLRFRNARLLLTDKLVPV